jgi:predicted  nucleic acid-binding Zn-ribbon protein
MSDNLADISELETRMADVRENLRVLVEQAAAYSGAGDEDLMSDRIAEQEEELDRLTKERDELARGKP